MNCPACDKHIRHDYLEEECIEANDTFDCPVCAEKLRLIVDESSYQGAMQTHLEIV